MKGHPSWLHRVPEIIEQLALVPDSYLDRNACEVLFGLGYSATVNMLKEMGASQLGRSLVISRPLLMARVREKMEHPEYSWVAEHRGRVADTVIKAKAQLAVSIRPAPALEGLAFEDLPGVTLTSSRFTIEHSGPEDLLQKLMAAARAMLADPDRFVASAKTGSVASDSAKPKTAAA